MARRTGWLVGAVGLTVGACMAEPPTDVYVPCRTSEDCSVGLACLHALGGVGDADLMCTRPCQETTDCPRIVSQHCGNLATCLRGVCAINVCK